MARCFAHSTAKGGDGENRFFLKMRLCFQFSRSIKPML
jgi:hypothetical protein